MSRRALLSTALATAATAALVLAPAAQATAPVGDAPTWTSGGLAQAGVIPAIAASAEAEYEVPGVDIEVTPAPRTPATVAAAVADGSAAATVAASGTDYSFGVYQAGHQEALDRCNGWVWEDFGGYGRVVSSHNHCGGAVVLGLEVGDTVQLSGYGEGTYVVTRLKTVSKGAPATVLEGRLWMQTCLWEGDLMRIAELTRV